MTTITINNYQQCEIEQRILEDQLIENGLSSALGKAGGLLRKIKTGSIKSARRFGAGAGVIKAPVGKASKASKSYKVGKIATIQAKRAGLKAKRFSKSPGGKMAIGGAAIGGAGATGAVTGAGFGSLRNKRKKS